MLGLSCGRKETVLDVNGGGVGRVWSCVYFATLDFLRHINPTVEP